MQPIDNSNMLGINKNFDYSGWQPRFKYVWDAANKRVVITDETATLPANAASTNVNVQIHDKYGNTAYGNLATGGAGYGVAPTVNIAAPGGGGTQAVATSIIRGGRVVGFNITNAGSGYGAAPLVTITPTGSDAPTAQAVATARIVNGALVSLNLTTASSGNIDISNLSVNKGLNISADVTITNGWTATGSAIMITPAAAGGYLQDWNKNVAPASADPGVNVY